MLLPSSLPPTVTITTTNGASGEHHSCGVQEDKLPQAQLVPSSSRTARLKRSAAPCAYRVTGLDRHTRASSRRSASSPLCATSLSELTRPSQICWTRARGWRAATPSPSACTCRTLPRWRLFASRRTRLHAVGSAPPSFRPWFATADAFAAHLIYRKTFVKPAAALEDAFLDFKLLELPRIPLDQGEVTVLDPAWSGVYAWQRLHGHRSSCLSRTRCRLHPLRRLFATVHQTAVSLPNLSI